VTMPSTVIGGIYKHSATRQSYRVLTLAVSSTNGTLDGKILVVYISLTDGTIYAREETEFHEHVPLPKADKHAPCLCDARGQGSCSKHPDQSLHPRFRLDRCCKP
jgi:hypothetical protein